MMKKIRLKHSLFLWASLTSASLASFLAMQSCAINGYKINLKNNFFEQYNQDQINELVGFSNFYNLEKDGREINYIKSKIYNNSIKFKLNNDLIINVSANNKKPIEVKEIKKFDDLFIEYDNDKVVKNPYYLYEEKMKRYGNDFFIPDIQMTIKNIIDNYQYYFSLLPNYIDIKNLRAYGWSINHEQKKYLQNIIKVHLLKYNFDVNDFNVVIDIDPNKVNKKNDFVSFNIDIVDSKNKSLLSDKSKKVKFYITNFLNYLKSSVLSIDFWNEDDNTLFNEYLNFPVLKFKDNPWNWTNYDNLVDNVKNLNDKMSAKTFISLVHRQKDLFYIDVPYEKSNEDLSYEITDFIEYAPFPKNSYSVVKLNIKVNKKDGTSKIYPWYSIDFNVHYHLFKGYVANNNLDYTSADLWDVYKLEKFDNKLVEGIDANNFFRKNIEKIVSYIFFKERNNLQLWANRNILQVEAYQVYKDLLNSNKYIETMISNIVLSFLISNKENDFYSGIKDVSINTYEYQNPGKLIITIDFIDYNNKSLLSEENRNKKIVIDCFKGTNNKLFLDNFKMKNDNFKMKDTPLIAYFEK
ncbi:MAG3240 family lipoprotein [Mycoplasma crocodyli]|uniref:MAG3240 family lipoprotein n=1 Tax=Mycoplasma crocodyli TaxID=50052 RepID=UPI00030B070C|nr:hypothetical protein [Mycoplasma crocodyli]